MSGVLRYFFVVIIMKIFFLGVGIEVEYQKPFQNHFQSLWLKKEQNQRRKTCESICQKELLLMTCN